MGEEHIALRKQITDSRSEEGRRILEKYAPELTAFLERHYKGFLAFSPGMEELLPWNTRVAEENRIWAGYIGFAVDIYVPRIIPEINTNPNRRSWLKEYSMGPEPRILEARLILPDRNDGNPITLRQVSNYPNTGYKIKRDPSTCRIPFP